MVTHAPLISALTGVSIEIDTMRDALHPLTFSMKPALPEVPPAAAAHPGTASHVRRKVRAKSPVVARPPASVAVAAR